MLFLVIDWFLALVMGGGGGVTRILGKLVPVPSADQFGLVHIMPAFKEICQS